MNVDNKFHFKSYLSENKLNNGGVKTTIDQSAVSAGENANVDLDLSNDDGSNKNQGKSKKNKKSKVDFLEKKATVDEAPKKSDAEIKQTNLKLLNLI